jgi:FkbM family methyltransferase
MIYLGSQYGGWHFLPLPSLKGSTVFCAGAGEDISFDIEIANRFGCSVMIIDPTPRAAQHFSDVANRFGDPSKQAFVSGGKQPVTAYDLTEINANRIQFSEKALWNKKEKLKFFLPKDPGHVSHSLINYQNNYRDDTAHIEVDTATLDSIASDYAISLNALELLKLDIEGAETVVIPYLIANGIRPKQLLVEFDELCEPCERATESFFKCHHLIIENNYRLVHFDGSANFLYVRGDIPSQ